MKKKKKGKERSTEETLQPGCIGKPFMDMQYCVWMRETAVDTLHTGIYHMREG